MTETTGSTLGFIEFFDNTPFHCFVTSHHHLGNAFAIIDHKVFLRKIDHNHPNLTTIIGIYRAGRIEQTNSFLQSQAGTGTHLCLITGRESDK